MWMLVTITVHNAVFRCQQALLPATGTWFNSHAFWIDPAGNVYGAAQGINAGADATFAVEWSPVPEPTTGAVVLIARAGVLKRPRRERCR